MAEDGRDKTIRELIAEAQRDQAEWLKIRNRLCIVIERAKPYLFNSGDMDLWEEACAAVDDAVR